MPLPPHDTHTSEIYASIISIHGTCSPTHTLSALTATTISLENLPTPFLNTSHTHWSQIIHHMYLITIIEPLTGGKYSQLNTPDRLQIHGGEKPFPSCPSTHPRRTYLANSITSSVKLQFITNICTRSSEHARIIDVLVCSSTSLGGFGCSSGPRILLMVERGNPVSSERIKLHGVRRSS